MTKEPTTSQIIHRGLCGKCPSCGAGKMLRKYIIPLDKCSNCELEFAPLRSDDGPAWATVLISGHLSMPFVFWILELGLENTFLEILYSVMFIIFLSAIILPCAKGIFMAIIWMMHVRKDPDT
ncbi:MAG: DUF983 domain-containing protein [Alphaproteobacteria bacterium]